MKSVSAFYSVQKLKYVMVDKHGNQVAKFTEEELCDMLNDTTYPMSSIMTIKELQRKRRFSQLHSN